MDEGPSSSPSRSVDCVGGGDLEVTRGSESEINGHEGSREEAVSAGRNVVVRSSLTEASSSHRVNDDVASEARGERDEPPSTGVRSVCGRRKEMEDAVAVVHSFLSLPASDRLENGSGSSDLHFFGVYDGHGGAQAANLCRERLHMALAEEMRARLLVDDDVEVNPLEGKVWETSMKASFLRMDGEVGSRAGTSVDQAISNTSSDTVGSTAIVAVLSCRHIIVANCGDSRAVLCRKGQAIALSQDHKPEREDEMARIEAAGGRVICWNGYRVLGVLAMSRAIGDHFLKPYVIADPDVTITPRSEDDDCLILASDGLWDVVSNQDACTIARRCLAATREAQSAASALAHAAHEKGSGDNISVVVVDLKNRKP